MSDVFREAAESLHEGVVDAYQIAGRVVLGGDSLAEGEELLDKLAELASSWDSVAGGWVDR